MGRFDLAKKLDTGDRFKLVKDDFGLDNIRVELTWQHADLDTQAWLLNDEGVIVNDAAFLFYNSMNRTEPFSKEKFGNKRNWLESTMPMSADGAAVGPHDELEGGIEKINISLSKIAPEVQEVLISATVHHTPQAENFGEVDSAKLSIIDEDSDEVLCYFELSKDFQSEDAMVAGRFINNEEGIWEFEAVGKAYDGGLQTLVDIYAPEE